LFVIVLLAGMEMERIFRTNTTSTSAAATANTQKQSEDNGIERIAMKAALQTAATLDPKVAALEKKIDSIQSTVSGSLPVVLALLQRSLQQQEKLRKEILILRTGLDPGDQSSSNSKRVKVQVDRDANARLMVSTHFQSKFPTPESFLETFSSEEDEVACSS
jgi:hypothetical protein